MFPFHFRTRPGADRSVLGWGGTPTGALSRLLARAGLVLLLGSGPGSFALDKTDAPEYLLKARILLTLLPYVEWPPMAAQGDSPFDIVVLGKSPFGSHLDDELKKMTVHHRVIRVRYVSRAAEAEGCQALFICASEARRIDDILAWTRGRQILTLSDSAGLAGRGVMVNLLLEEQKVKLAVNLDATRASGFVLNSRLMPLTRIIATSPPPGRKG